MSIDLAHLRTWIGKSESRSERIAAFPAQAMAATLNRDEDYNEGNALPPLWHWLYFLPLSKLSLAGPDGHTMKGGFLPPVALPRRMWAGGRFTFHRPLLIGEVVQKRSTVVSVDHKSGRSGELVFVTVRHDLSDKAGPCLTEEHDIVYRDIAPQGMEPPVPPQAPQKADYLFPIHPDPVLLFRYSALTFNSHRIHYDQPYVTGVEGYPGLIVHGPLIATLLLDGLLRFNAGINIRTFEFRAISPLFDTADFAIAGQISDKQAELWAQNATGGLAMTATATIG